MRSTFLPGFIPLGHFITNGERTPPSFVLPFLSLIPPFHLKRAGPLSLKNKIIVLSSIPSSLVLAIMRPTFSSIFSTIAKAALVSLITSLFEPESI